MSMVDVDSVGSGGGSIAWVDAVGRDPGRPALGRRRSGPGVLRPRRDRRRRSPTRSSFSGTSTRPASSTGGCRSTRARARSLRAHLGRRARARRGSDGVGHPRGRACVDGAGGTQPHRRVAVSSPPSCRCSRTAAVAGCSRPTSPRTWAAGARSCPSSRRCCARSAPRPRPSTGNARSRSRCGSPPTPGVLEPTLVELERAVLADLAGDGVDARRVHDRPRGRRALRTPRCGARDPDRGDAPATSRLVEALADAFRAEYVRRFGAGAVALGVAVEIMTLRAVGEDAAESDAGRRRAVASGAGRRCRAIDGSGSRPCSSIGRVRTGLRFRSVDACGLAVGHGNSRARRWSTPATRRCGSRPATSPRSTSAGSLRSTSRRVTRRDRSEEAR